MAARIERALTAVRGLAASESGDVRIEVGIDGAITRLDVQPSMWTRDAAGCIAGAHARALADAKRIGEEIRRELIEDPRIAHLVDGNSAPAVSVHTDSVHEDARPRSIYDRW